MTHALEADPLGTIVGGSDVLKPLEGGIVMEAIMGKALVVDLCTGESQTRDIPQQWFTDYIGGVPRNRSS